MRIRSVAVLGLVLAAGSAHAGTQGYYRTPCIAKDTIVFGAEGDLWKVPLTGGVAVRITTHAGDEGSPRVSADGSTLAFTAQYEGPTEVYTMPLGPGAATLPTRWTFEGGRASVSGWTPDGRLMYATDHYSTIPNAQMFIIDPRGGDHAGTREAVPLWQASAGTYDDTGKVLYFTRLAFQGSQTRRYKGGTAQNLWKFDASAPNAEASALTGDYPGTSKDPMWWKCRVYFATDRDGTMNIWSMSPEGKDLRQHTRHSGFEVASPTLSEGRIAYQLGADIHVLDLNGDKDSAVPISLESDLDQTRERWVPKPIEYMTSVHPSPDGDRVAITARGRVFVAPHRQGRLVEVARKEGVRYRAARFMPDGKSVIAMSDESGEIELWLLPANGVGQARQLTSDGDVLRWDVLPSPDGSKIAHTDKNYRLWITDVKTGTSTKVDQSNIDNLTELAWSPDGRYLAYAAPADNTNTRVKVYDTVGGQANFVTSDRFVSTSPAWSPDGQWMYFLSDRNLSSDVPSPWGYMQPEPFFDKTSKIYAVPLKEGQRSPWAPKDELQPKKDDKAKDDAKKDDGKKDDAKKDEGKKDEAKKEDDKKKPEVVIEWPGIEKRLIDVPLGPGNYSRLTVTDKALFFASTDGTGEKKTHLAGATITNENPEIKTFLQDIKSYEPSADLKKLMVHKGDAVYIIDASVADKVDLDKKNVVLNNWTLSVIPREEWRQMFTEAWRLERDYFYDTKMHGVDWKGVLEKYRPLVDRVTTRAELGDVIAQMVSELSALHTFVRGGDLREGEDQIALASFGAVLERDAARGGWRVTHVYRSDPDQPERASALARPGVNVVDGDVVEMINGVSTLSVPDYRQLLRGKAGAQVLLRVKPAAGGDSRDVIVVPMNPGAAADLRYHEWEYTRRLEVEKESDSQIGYLHLRAMGTGDYSDFARGYYPVFNRAGLIIDVRHNRGGNIDSWVLSRLLRKVWFYWSDRVGNPPNWNMQYAFRGHVAVLCDERTASDGEAFSEGIKRLKIGKVFGTRTWGGEIWLSSNNFLVDRGIATAAESGVYGPEGQWLIEGHGVEPDVMVDNLPHAAFKGEDAQLKAAIEYLKQKIKDEPLPPFVAPSKPDKSFKPSGK